MQPQALPKGHSQYLGQFLLDHMVNIGSSYLKASENTHRRHTFTFPFAVIPRLFAERAS